jgi:hypothetical protein
MAIKTPTAHILKTEISIDHDDNDQLVLILEDLISKIKIGTKKNSYMRNKSHIKLTTTPTIPFFTEEIEPGFERVYLQSKMNNEH